ncbi:MAG TPA: AraC family transcriptional regulator [Burkholderiaceae bacterium]|nr:AraC family transcriptional regulator [Burkholderiaceae bacterium]
MWESHQPVICYQDATLAGRLVADTSDLENAFEQSRPIFGDYQLHPTDRRGDFHCRLVQCPLGDVSVLGLKWGGRVQVRTDDAARDCYTVLLTTSGFADFHEAGGDSIRLSPERPVVLHPQRQALIDSTAGYEVTVLRIKEERILRSWAAIAGWSHQGVLPFESNAPVDRSVMESWSLLLKLAANIAAMPAGSGARRFSETALADSMSALLLTRHRHTMSRWLHETTPPVGSPSLVKRAEAFLIEHLQVPLDIAAVCSACGVSRRTLFDAFRRERQMGPAAWLREQRLQAARAALRDPASSELRVQDIAAQYCFAHAGDFSLTYRRRFGESPSDTHRGARSRIALRPAAKAGVSIRR